MSDFKIGDRVRCINPAWGLVLNNEYIVTNIDNINMITVESPDGFWHNDGLNKSRFELIISKENEDMATVNDVMNLELDADTQLLREEGIEDNTGALTSTGQSILMRTLYLANRKAVVAKVKEIVAARKANAADTDEDDE